MIYFSNQPLFTQVKDEVKRRIFSGIYKLGDKLPPIRELAIEMKVNPNTVVRAYAELEAEHLIITESTNGKFVTVDENLINEKRNAFLRTVASDYFKSAKDFGLTEEAALRILEDNYANTFSSIARFEIVRETSCAKRRIG